MIPREATTTALVDPQEDGGRKGVGDQPSPCVGHAWAAEPPALARQAFDAGGLEHIALTATHVPRICAKEQPEEDDGWLPHPITP